MRISRIAMFALLVLLLWIISAQCFILKNRIKDKTAKALFDSKNVELQIHDTIINGRHIHYALSGHDSLGTLVFIHGSPGSWSNYREYMWDTGLLKTYRIASIDRPGFGFSDFGNALDLFDQCDLLLPVLRKISNGKQLVVCGHSMGAPVAVRLAAVAPGLISKLILVGAPLDVQLGEKETWRRVMAHRPLYWALPGAFRPSNTELLYLKKDLVTLQDDFKKVTANIHFIHGDKDNWVPIENVDFGRWMFTQARSLRSDTIFGAGHYIPWKNRDAFRKMLLEK